jgi:7-carboxy-7-deazaguanine synthase
MFGTNEISKPFLDAKGDLIINEIFYTIQGEGPDAGRPAIFIRLAGCNLRCFFCDTDFERGEQMSCFDIGERVQALRKETDCRLVVITGGEPLLQNIHPLVNLLNIHQICVTVETAGSVWVEGLDMLFKSSRSHSPLGNAIICSPKTPLLHPKVARAAHALKYIIAAGEIDERDGLPIMSTQIPGKSARIARPNQCPNGKVYVQAMDVGDEAKNHANLLLASTIAMKFGYRLSVQLHKLAQLP